MHHLIEAKANPVDLFAVIRVATQVAGPRLDSVHRKMNHKIDQRQPPQRGLNRQRNDQSHEGVQSAVES